MVCSAKIELPILREADSFQAIELLEDIFMAEPEPPEPPQPETSESPALQRLREKEERERGVRRFFNR